MVYLVFLLLVFGTWLARLYKKRSPFFGVLLIAVIVAFGSYLVIPPLGCLLLAGLLALAAVVALLGGIIRLFSR